MPDNAKNATKVGNKAFRDMYFFYFLSTNALVGAGRQADVP